VVGNKLFGVAYVPRDGRAAVGLIRRGSDEYKAGMRQGDIILSIDGKPVRSFADFRRFSFITGNRHRLLLQDSGGRQKEVMLQK
jgi:S1-C subfamily serine protease